MRRSGRSKTTDPEDMAPQALPGGAAWSKHLNDANLGLAMANEKSTAPGDLDATAEVALDHVGVLVEFDDIAAGRLDARGQTSDDPHAVR